MSPSDNRGFRKESILPPVTAPDDLARTLADELATHRPYVTQGHRSTVASMRIPATIDGCQCGAPDYFAHLADHLASVVSRRDADLQAKAWDEGWKAAMRQASEIQAWHDSEGVAVPSEIRNPYRSRRPADTDTGRGQ